MYKKVSFRQEKNLRDCWLNSLQKELGADKLYVQKMAQGLSL